MRTRFGLAFVLFIVGCGDSDDNIQPLGTMEITTTSANTVTPADGWSVQINRFLVHYTSVTVAGSEGLSGGFAEAQVVDYSVADPKTLLSSTLRTARTWEDVNFQIGPATADSTLIGSNDADRELMAAAGLSVYLEGTLARADVTKTFKWGFKTDTLYSACTGGLVVPADATGSADIALAPGALFTDEAGVVAGDPVAAADADGNGEITLEELTTATLDARVLKIVRSYAATGSCTAEAVAPVAAGE